MVSHPLCQQCGERPAVIFITQTIDDHSSKGRFCEKCAREKAMGEGWLTELIEQWGDESLLNDEMREAIQEVPLDEIMLELFETEFPEPSEPLPGLEHEPEDDGIFILDDSSDEENSEESDYGLEAFDAEPFIPSAFAEPSPHFTATLRCPNCNTTWDRLKQDGRAGCGTCYSAFRTQLIDVMVRVQRGESHVGKTPREAQKRRRRAENIRARREHQLELLNNRLKEAVAAEKYEIAAKLRDKIKDVTSSSNGE
jgi:protein-arginine kinase activator protein McsA